MEINDNVSLLPYNTFGIEARASRLVEIRSRQDLEELLESGLLRRSRHLILGGGSNVVFLKDYDGLVVVMRTQEKKFQGERVTADAGVVLDDLVHECVAKGLYGLENLAAIPGTVGASAVQNVGAYGAEAKDVIESVLARDLETGEARVLTNEECGFAYRWSAFKGGLAGRYLIQSVTYRLKTTFEPSLVYQGLAKALQQEGLAHPTAQELVDAVTRMRWAKLPKPGEVGSAGSFFKNPVVAPDRHAALKERYPDLVSFPAGEGCKLAAGWLIEKAGWKGRNLGHAGVWGRQALVLVNADGKATGKDVADLADAVVQSVEERFGVRLEREAIYV